MSQPPLFLSALGVLALFSAPAAAQQIGGQFETGLEIRGEVGEIGFGLSISIKDDMNGDGVDDILIGAPGKNNGSGGVYLHDGATGAKIWLINGLNQGDRFGTEVATIDDLDGDGYKEFLVAAPGQNGFTGAVYLFDGLTQVNYTVIHGDDLGDNFGEALEVLPDMNGDGFRDFAVGADIATDGPVANSGVVYIYDPVTRNIISKLVGPEPDARFGSFIAELGDLNGDQVTDLCIGAKGTEIDLGSGIETDVGRAFVVSGADGSLIFAVTGETAFGYFGSTTAKAGDMNLDGVPDVIVAAQEYTDPQNGAECGAIYIYDGATGNLLRKHIGEGPGDKFGGAVLGNVDVNNDGRLDIVVGAPIKDLDQVPDSFAGAFYVISGGGPTLLRSVGDGFRERRGAEFELIGDRDGDGQPEFYVASPEYRPPGVHPRVGRLLEWEFNPFLYTDNTELSASNGGQINFDVQFPIEDANFFYQILISGGRGPTYTNNGVAIPLSQGNIFFRTLNGDYNFLSSHTGMSGTLDANAQATAMFDQVSLPATLIGKTYYMAAVSSNNGIASHSSANRRLVILP